MEKPIIAIMYDFDKTLCTKDMQDYGFIPELGMESHEFWDDVNKLTDEQAMDSILAYMYTMVEKAKQKKKIVSKEIFNQLGKDIEYFGGVDSWFERINKYATEIGVNVEHYIVSSGIKEIIEGTSIADYFKRIYASEFMYDYTGSIEWPKHAINYTAKTQFLFRINKGVLNIESSSSAALNQFTPENERRVPFENMIYIGDGLTDVPCMKLVSSFGGQSIAVYNQMKGKDAAQNLLESKRVNYVAPADYGSDSEIEKYVKSTMKKIQAVTELESYCIK